MTETQLTTSNRIMSTGSIEERPIDDREPPIPPNPRQLKDGWQPRGQVYNRMVPRCGSYNAPFSPSATRWASVVSSLPHHNILPPDYLERLTHLQNLTDT